MFITTAIDYRLELQVLQGKMIATTIGLGEKKVYNSVNCTDILLKLSVVSYISQHIIQLLFIAQNLLF